MILDTLWLYDVRTRASSERRTVDKMTGLSELSSVPGPSARPQNQGNTRHRSSTPTAHDVTVTAKIRWCHHAPETNLKLQAALFGVSQSRSRGADCEHSATLAISNLNVQSKLPAPNTLCRIKSAYYTSRFAKADSSKSKNIDTHYPFNCVECQQQAEWQHCFLETRTKAS